MNLKNIINQAKKGFATRSKRFYKEVSIKEVKNPNYQKDVNDRQNLSYKLSSLSKLNENYYQVTLDNKKCLSAYQDEFFLPSKKLALSIAAEYQQQDEYVDFNYMNLVNLW